MPLSVADFVRKWKISSLTELQGSQSHFIDLCEMLGVSTPTTSDPTGDRFCFNKALTKTYGGKGFADVWKSGYFAWEYKGKHKDLKAAYRQINDYREDLGNPPLLVVCDLDRFEVHTNFENTSKRVYAFNLDDLNRNQVTATCPLPPLEVLRALFGDYNVLRPNRTDAFVTQEAAKLFATLAERLEIEHQLTTSKEQIAHFLIRLLFCLFADSVGLLPDRVFRRLVDIDHFYPRRFLRKLPLLFTAMAEPDGIFGEHTIRWFNGDLFKDNDVIQIDKRDMGVLHDLAHKYDWSHVAPAIFGTLFERSLNDRRRSLIGAHYTSEEDILLLIEPVVMRPLQQRWQQTREQILERISSPVPVIDASTAAIMNAARRAPHTAVILSEQRESKDPRISPSSTPPTPPATSAVILSAAKDPEASHAAHTIQTFQPKKQPASSAKSNAKQPSLLHSNKQAEDLLASFFDYLASIRILDPACGSGNFLYVALRRLLDLWKEARDFAVEHNIQLATKYAVEKMVSPSQLFGIEIEFYAHELASIVVWIGFLQWKHEHGILEDREPILQKLSNIEHADAILRYDAEGKPFEPQWPKADFIVGNPPFLGGKKLRRELGDQYVDDLFALYETRVGAESDLVVYWFEKARIQVNDQHVKSVGLLATQSIRKGTNRAVIEAITRETNLFWAWSDREWVLDGAAVRVSMIAFGDSCDQMRQLDGEPVGLINPDLSSETDTSAASPLRENQAICFQGTIKVGDFDLNYEDAKKMINAPVNPNGKQNSEVIVPWINASDVTGRRRGNYIIDFGPYMTREEAAFFEWPYEYLRVHVKPARDKVNRKNHREKWWLHAEARPGMRKALSKLKRFIVTPRVAKHRFFVWEKAGTLPDSRLFVFARSDDFFFGILHSAIHETWSLVTSSRHGVGNDPTYNNESTFDTFPFPWPPGTEPSEAESPIVFAIAEAARTLVRLRDNWLNPPGASEDDLKSRTLTKLYNERPEWLANAHRTLDEAVFAAYGWPSTLTKQEILSRLLALNHQRANTNSGAPSFTASP